MNHPHSLQSNDQDSLASSIRPTHTRLDQLPSASFREFFLWAIRRRKRFRVAGPSMLPFLQPDEEVLVNLDAYGRGCTPQPGDVVIVVHPHNSSLRMVKRVIEVLEGAGEAEGAGFSFDSVERGTGGAGEAGERYYWVEGDNLLASTDSRTFGPVPFTCILGKVTARFA